MGSCPYFSVDSWFLDDYANAANDQVECMQRATDYELTCGPSSSVYGWYTDAQLQASWVYVVNGRPQQFQLNPGDALPLDNYYTNPGGQLVYQTDGNLVLYENGVPNWAANEMPNFALPWGAFAGANCSNGCSALLQSDGNMVLYNAQGAAYWATDTAGRSGVRLMLSQGYPSVSIYDASGALAWSTAVPGDAYLSTSVFGAPLNIGTSTQYAGAIDSLVWNGMQFVDTHDHGREMQTAFSYDSLAECGNPTEAGSADDSSGPTSSSVQQAFYSNGINQLVTEAQMAYWWRPGEACESQDGVTSAQGVGAVSDDSMIKAVTVGAFGLPDLIQYSLSLNIAEPHTSVALEGVTGYMPPEFSQFWQYTPENNTFWQIDGTPGLGTPMVILSTQDQQYALGVFAAPVAGWGVNYGHAAYDGAGPASKWSAYFGHDTLAAGWYNFDVYVYVGTFADVSHNLAYALLVQPLVFDASWYLANYSDLQAAFGSDTNAATQHWLNYGIYEGRQGAPGFSTEQYLAMYPDVASAYGATNYWAAASDYVDNGWLAGRQGTY